MLRRTRILGSPARLLQELDVAVDLHALHRYAPERYPFFLQSTAGHSSLGRFDILFTGASDSIVLERIGDLDMHGGFLGALDTRWQQESEAPVDTELPFTGGWFLYLGYELAAEIEPGLSLPADSQLPVAFAVRCRAAIARDHLHDRCWLIREAEADVDEQRVKNDLMASGIMHDDTRQTCAPAVQEESPDIFLDAVRRAKRHIAAGDIYQANLSRGWSAKIDERLDADRIYDALCVANPAPFAGLARWRDTAIISSSPERLLSIDNGMAATRPIAGTRPRSEDRSIDDGLSAELITHPKERAEHVMLIDLERNDLGRICEPGSVAVDEMMVVESYAHVHHIVSNVSGRLRENVTPGEAVRAVFPGGTITGCPKIRCMEIIQALESGPRGAYTGSFGYLNRDGSLDLNILIRTMVQKGNCVTFRAGSGIVADSSPEAELAETRAKAKGMLQALTR